MSPKEAALSLYCSLSGEPEEELEHIDINKYIIRMASAS